MAEKLLRLSFYLLFLITPLIFTPFNYELFEFNKMLTVYFLAICILGLWIIRMISTKSLIFKKTPLDIPLGIFFLSQVLSTIFSIDPHTSVYGYYSRLNGGLLSITAYLILYYAFVSNFQGKEVMKFLKATLISGLLVSLYAIPEHFGWSPSCTILSLISIISGDNSSGIQFNASCWVQDVQARVFATLGQPNWLGAYLSMLIFPCIYFILTSKNTFSTIRYTLYAILLYLAFTFTFSRGALLGFLGGIIIFAVLVLYKSIQLKDYLTLKLFAFLIAIFVFINLIFGSSLTGDFRLIKNASTVRPTLSGQIAPQVGTQLENGGTESGQIRLIVWQGAIDIFKAYPLLGSGVETFAYAYYNFRPVSHNLVSEWDFLYNKAHNEYLNYLANTGIAGFLSYMSFIFVFIIWSIKRIMKYEAGMSEALLRKKHNSSFIILNASLLAGYISYLVQNFFGFSVVIIALLFYLFPAFAFSATDSTKNLKISRTNFLITAILFLPGLIYKRQIYSWIFRIIFTLITIYCLFIAVVFLDLYSYFKLLAALIFTIIIYKPTLFLRGFQSLIILITIFFLLQVINLWRADTFYKLGNDYNGAGNPGQAYNSLVNAVHLRSDEPLYLSELGSAAASSAISLAETDATLSAELKGDAKLYNDAAIFISPKDVSLWRNSIRTLYTLYLLDPSFEEELIQTLDGSISLAPTDPKLYFNRALILSNIYETDKEKNEPSSSANKQKLSEATSNLEKAIELKSDYNEARLNLAKYYIEAGENQKAKSQLEYLTKLLPEDKEIQDLLKKVGE